MLPSPFEYYSPRTVPEALKLLTQYSDDAKILAGGQSLISMLKLRLAAPKCLIDLGRIGDLNYIREEKGKIVIGAMTPYVAVQTSKLLQEKCKLLPETTQVIADVQIRTRGTIGGSIAHADPAGDMPAAILAVKADLKATGPKGDRWIKAEDFFVGLYATALEGNEILTEIRLPVLTGYKTHYVKAARRPSDYAIAGVAVCLKTAADGTCEDIGIGITGIADRTFRASTVEQKLKGQKLDKKTIEAAAPLVTEGLDIAGNMHAGPEYRAHMARVYLTRAILAAK
jgi:aerobic carbon-monoxide dehydrogenase medium subunit